MFDFAFLPGSSVKDIKGYCASVNGERDQKIKNHDKPTEHGL